MWLFVFLLGIGAAQELPFLLMIVAPSHQAFLSKNHQRVDLVLHHPGNQDAHERGSATPKEHRHDLLDQIFFVPDANPGDHSDHKIDLPDENLLSLTKIKTGVAPSPLFFLENRSLPVASVPPLAHRLPFLPLPQKNPIQISLRTTLLLI
ncbi:MAG: hypothetical protein WAO55_15545 [Candidatus Manganitrophaceae bacterium]